MCPSIRLSRQCPAVLLGTFGGLRGLVLSRDCAVIRLWQGYVAYASEVPERGWQSPGGGAIKTKGTSVCCPAQQCRPEHSSGGQLRWSTLSARGLEVR